MSGDYIFARVKEALRLHKGNSVKARQQIIAWTYEDAKLLHSLARPHLTGIVAYAVDRYQRKILAPELEKDIEESCLISDAAVGSRGGKNSQAHQEEENFGREMLKSLVGGQSDIFGQEPTGVAMGRKKASPRHEEILRFIARKSNKP